RPGREKDIRDIDYILANFFDLHIGEIYNTESDIPDLYEDELKYFDKMVSARYVGRKMRDILASSPELRARMIQLLRTQAERFQMSRLLSHGDNIENSQRIIKAMYLGMMDKKAQ
ncbi:MAG: hypothetical protein ACE5D7_10775, partial [Fidelibacterota bacterium]